MPLTSSWPPEAAKSEDISTALGSGANYLSQHGSQASLKPRATAWTTDTNMSFGGIADMVVLQGGAIQKENLSVCGIIAQSQCDPVARWQVLALCLTLHKLQAVVYHSIDPTGQGRVHLSPLSHLSQPSHL